MKNHYPAKRKNRERSDFPVNKFTMPLTQFGWLSLLLILVAVNNVHAGSTEDLKTLRITQSKGDGQKVARLGDLFLKKYPDSKDIPEILFVLANVNDDLDKKRQSLGQIKRDHGNSPWAARAYLEMGKIYLLKGDNVLAAREFSSIRKKYRKSPFLGEAILLTGISYLANGDYGGARLNFEKAIQTSHNDDIKTWAKIGIADTYYLSGEFRTSMNFYKRLSHRKIKNEFKTKVLLNLALSHSALGSHDEANKVLQRLVKDYPASLEAYRASKQLSDMEDNKRRSEGGTYLQAGVYSTLKGAAKYKSKLSDMGLESTILEGEVYKVFLGPFGDAIEAQIYSESLKNEKGIDSFVFER